MRESHTAIMKLYIQEELAGFLFQDQYTDKKYDKNKKSE